MVKTNVLRAVRTGILVVVFAVGYLCGTVNQRPADAQLGGLLERGSGVLGTAKELGSSIVEMQDHVNGLQKNLETLKKVQSALTGK
jgi:hypothetical protein